MPGGKTGEEGQRSTPTVEPIRVVSTRETATPNLNSDLTSKSGSNSLQREIDADQRRATAFGTDATALYRSLGKQRTITRTTGGKNNQRTTRSSVFSLSSSAQAKFDKAQADFLARGGNRSEAEAISRVSGGGNFQSSGDFGPGGIQIGGVKPLGG